jgi:hypothetical protein
VLIDGRVGKRILLERKLKRSASRKSPRKRSDKKCPKGTIKNPDTQKCVLIDGRVGKRILLERKLKRSASRKSPRKSPSKSSNKKCPTGTIFEKSTKDCVLIEGQAGKRILLERKLKELASRGIKKHSSDLIWNSESKKWVLIDGRVGKSVLLAKKLSSNSSATISTSSSSVNTSSSIFPSATINTSSSSVPFVTSSTSSSDDLLSPLPKSIGNYISRLPPPPPSSSRIQESPPSPSIRSPEPRIQHKTVHFSRLPPRPRRSPSPFIRSPSPSRLPTRIEPIVFLPPPTIPEKHKYEYFPAGPLISKIISPESIREDCKYIKQWEKGIETGSGEVGKTRIVNHKDHDYSYVLKSQKKGGEFTSQFRAEIRALLELQGTDLVPKIYDVWTCNTRGYIIMEQLYNCDHIDPQILYKKVEKKLELLRQRGWLHVDTHDGNVMCTGKGEPVIIDFGYAVQRKAGGDSATYPEHPKSQPIRKNGWGVDLPWKFLEIMQQVNFHESFNPYGSKIRNIKQKATKQNKIDYINVQKKYIDAQQNLREEFGYRY